MHKTIRKFNSFEEVKDEEYRYWQSLPPAERIEAAFQLSVDQYRMKGIEPDGSALRQIDSNRKGRPKAARLVIQIVDCAGALCSMAASELSALSFSSCAHFRLFLQS